MGHGRKMGSRQVNLAVGILILLVKLNAQKTGNRAASSQVNCGCHCSNLTFRDKYGKVQGNCKSAAHTGAKWCYVGGWGSPCQDKRNSKRFNKPWSYEACATPPAHLCGGGGGGGCGRWGCGGNTGGGGFGGGSGGGGYGGSGSGGGCTCPRSLRLQPVCGRDGRTYRHSCACTCGGTTVQCQGACPCPSGGFTGIGVGPGSGSGSGSCGYSGCGNSGGCGSLAQILGNCGRSGNRKPKKYRNNRRNRG